MQLIADRFAVTDRGDTIDLATGVRVCLITATACGATEQAQWAERCAWFGSLVHPAIAPLLDYGPIGETERFEAWAGRPGWPGAPAAGHRCLHTANQVLLANGRTPSRSGALATVGSHPVAIPDMRGGVLTNDRSEQPAPVRREALAIVRTSGRRVALVADIFNAAPEQRGIALACWAPEQEPVGHAVHVLARAARLAGFVPMAVDLVDSAVRRLVKGRSLLLVGINGVEPTWARLIDATLDTPKPHIALFAGHVFVPRVHLVPLERASAEALARSVCPPGAPLRPHLRHISAAARRSAGFPSRFEELLFGRSSPRLVTARRDGGRAAEPIATFDAEPEATPSIPAAAREWPAPGELARLRRQALAARALLAAGRHAPGERQMRKTVAALARRGDWSSAADGAVALARALAARGRMADAQAAIDLARPWATRARDLPELQDLAIAQAVVWIDCARLREAETLLEATVAGAVSANTGRAGVATLALVRCLFWQGRYHDASQRLAGLRVEGELPETERRRLPIARAHVALGRGRIAEALAEAARARDEAAELASADIYAEALHACALGQLAAGDMTQARATATAALVQARRAHDALLAIRLRLLLADIARRQGRRGAAALVVERLSRLSQSRLPATVRAELDVLRDVLGGAAPDRAAEQRADATGLQALRLLPAAGEPGAARASAADEVVELLQCCQAAAEDAAVLASVAVRVRRRLGAIAVTFFVFDQGQAVAVSSDGMRVDASAAQRVHTAGQLVLPHHGGVEPPHAGVPVRYAGHIVGALVATWGPMAPLPPEADVALILSTAATAAAPAVSAVIARRDDSQRSRTADLLGVSPGIELVRAAIEKAAGAPFAVLVEGESGTGKELVAKLLHRLGPRRDRLFCTLNCAALPDELIESELFGHARGAFTGALGERRGLFEEAHGGSLFLDEIGELSLRAQSKVLRAIQEGEIRRVGENVCRRVDVRLITATNRNLREEVARGRFRMDLLYRLDVIRIVLPPLRDRRDDIPLLAEHFWREATTRLSSRATLSSGVIAALTRYDWAGNIRELQNVLSSLAVRSPRRGVIAPSALPPAFDVALSSQAEYRLDAARQCFERAFIRAALVRAGGQRTRAAEELGITRQGLAKLISRLGIEMPDDAEAEAAEPTTGRK